MTTVAVVGPGSVGTFFAAHLAAAGHDVLACARRPFTEYVVESPVAPVRAPAAVVTDPDQLDGHGRVDWVLMAVKAHQTDDTAPWLDQLCGDGTTVVSVQNGIEAEERLRPLVHGAAVLPSVVYCGSELVAPGHIAHRSHGTLIVPTEPSADGLAALFAGTPAEVRPTSGFVTEAWRKLGINVVANGITALTLRTMVVLGRPDVAELARELLAECWAVGRAEGADVAAEDIAPLVDTLRQSGPDRGTSMLYDRRAGRTTEHDAIYGAVVRAGRRHDIATPLNAVVRALLAASDPDVAAL